jgi:hemolysin III
MTALILHPRFDERDLQALASHPVYGTRPRLRGRLHQVAAVASAPAGFYLVTQTSGTNARSVAIVYAITLTLMFSTSACYHRLAQSIAARFWMRRLDHSMIFVHLAGATTPVAILGVAGPLGRSLLMLSWGGALVGVGLKITQLTIEQDPCPWLFPLLGGLPLLTLPALALHHGAANAALLLGSALVYGVGAACFSKKSPDPVPTVFGYHEVWHLFTLLGGLFQFVLTLRLAA